MAVSGDHCFRDNDGCGTNPCLSLVNCVDFTPQEEADSGYAFNCRGCPEGYEDESVGSNRLDRQCVGKSQLHLHVTLPEIISDSNIPHLFGRVF